MRIWHRVAVIATALTVTALGTTGAGSTAAAATQARQRDAVTFEVASFNILGSNHTVNSNRWASGKVRARLAKKWLAGEGTSVVGFQEGQVDQMKALTRSGVWTAYPDPRQSVNTQTAQSVAWLSADWALVEARTFVIPFHYNQEREQPMVLLQHRGTGQQVWVVSVHLTSGGNERATWERKVGTRKLAKNVRELEATGVPVVVTGDMNDHGTFFCRLAAKTTLRSPAGGSHDGVCSPPPAMRIDWIFGSPNLGWTGFRYAEDGLLGRITDHTVPLATATIG